MRFADPLSIKFQKLTVKNLKQKARKEKKPISQIVRELIEKALEGEGRPIRPEDDDPVTAKLREAVALMKSAAEEAEEMFRANGN